MHRLGKCPQELIQNIGIIFKSICQDHKSFESHKQAGSGAERRGGCVGNPGSVSAALPHGPWHATCSATSCHLAGECEKTATPGITKHSVLKSSNKLHCSYLANYHYLSIYPECIHLEPSKSTHCDMMNVYVMGKRMLQRKNLALSRKRCRKSSVIHTVLSRNFITCIFYTEKCVYSLRKRLLSKSAIRNKPFNPLGTTW